MKRVLVIQDFCVFGKTGANVSVSLFSGMGIEAVVVPVFLRIFNAVNDGSQSVLSTESECVFQPVDLSYKFREYAEYFVENKIYFDCVFVNGCFTKLQVENINDLLNRCLSNDCFFVYCFQKEQSGGRMKLDSRYCYESLADYSFYKKLLEKSNIIISRLEDIFYFAGVQFDENSIDDREYVEKFFSDREFFPNASIIATDFFINKRKNGIILAENKNNDVKWLYSNNYNSGFLGLNDIFSAIVTGAIINRINIEKAVRIGIDFTQKAVKNTLSKPDHNWYGADFESILHELKLISTLQPSDS